MNKYFKKYVGTLIRNTSRGERSEKYLLKVTMSLNLEAELTIGTQGKYICTE